MDPNYTAHEAKADARLAFLDHTPPDGEVVVSEANFNEKEQRFHVEIKAEYPDGCREGTVYISGDRGYFLCIHTVVQNNQVSFPFSWDCGWIH